MIDEEQAAMIMDGLVQLFSHAENDAVSPSDYQRLVDRANACVLAAQALRSVAAQRRALAGLQQDRTIDVPNDES